MKIHISKKVISIAFILLVIIAIPITLFALSTQQDIRQRAQVSQNTCLSKTAINILIDKSLSMGNSVGSGSTTKMSVLKGALGQFVDYLSANDQDFYIGIDVFGAPTNPPNGAFTELDFVRYRENSSLIESKINNLSVGSGGGTYMSSGFQVAINKINSAKSRPELAGYKFVTIVFSDGVPEVSGQSGSQCVAESTSGGIYVCFAKSEDPRLASPNRAVQMQNITDKVYSVVIYNDQAGSRGYSLNSLLLQLMKDIADDPDSTYFYNATTSNPSELNDIFQTIPQDICEPTPTTKPTSTPSPTPTKTPTPSPTKTPTPTASSCPVPKMVDNIRITCPFCGL